jgi:hypothetical protein
VPLVLAVMMDARSRGFFPLGVWGGETANIGDEGEEGIHVQADL